MAPRHLKVIHLRRWPAAQQRLTSEEESSLREFHDRASVYDSPIREVRDLMHADAGFEVFMCEGARVLATCQAYHYAAPATFEIIEPRVNPRLPTYGGLKEFVRLIRRHVVDEMPAVRAIHVPCLRTWTTLVTCLSRLEGCEMVRETATTVAFVLTITPYATYRAPDPSPRLWRWSRSGRNRVAPAAASYNQHDLRIASRPHEVSAALRESYARNITACFPAERWATDLVEDLGKSTFHSESRWTLFCLPNDGEDEGGADGTSVGASCLVEYDDVMNTCEIHTVCVCPGSRGRGSCGRLVGAVVDRLSRGSVRRDVDRGVRVVTIQCEARNMAAYRCYASVFGPPVSRFVPTGPFADFDGEPVVDRCGFALRLR